MEKIKSCGSPFIPRQTAKLQKRHLDAPTEMECCGMKIRANTGVYDTEGDSELIAETVKISPLENFLEIGCGTGVVSIFLARKSHSGVGVDINALAVENSKFNAKRLGVANVMFLKSDVFKNVDGKFDVIVCNPPYTNHDVADDIDRMFWDPSDEMKKTFFKEVGDYLKENGRIYFGWANFGDIDIDLPLRLAAENGYILVNTSEMVHPKGYSFIVFEFKR